MKTLELERPLVFFDLETTGIDPASDRVVELSALRVEPAGGREARTRRINPERPIPPEASAVHGITDDDVRDAPTFRQIARGLLDWLDGADLAGFNVSRFDVPLLDREFRDCGLELGLQRRNVVDAMTIFHRMERRDLSAAVRFYLGRDHEGAHSAEADVLAAAEVLEAQLERYAELPRSVTELAGWMRQGPPGAVDPDAKFVWRGDAVVFAFGKHRDKELARVVREDAGYLRWILGSDFPEDAKRVVAEALEGRYPRRS